MKSNKIILCAMMTSFLFVTGNIYTAKATEIPENTHNIIKQQGVSIEDIDKKIDNMIASIPPLFGFLPYNRFPYMFGESVDVSGINIENTNVTSVVPLFIGSNTFENRTDRLITYNTSSFSKSITDSTTTQTLHGFKTAFEASGKVGIPLVTEGQIKTTLEYNFSNTDSTTKSVTTTYTATPQSIPVPPYTKTRTDVYLNQVSISGNVEIYADAITGIKAESSGTVISIGAGLDLASNTYGLIRSPKDPDRVRAIGSGKFNLIHGADFFAITYDITYGEASARIIDVREFSLK
ncbi:epsilon-toxin family protein [Lysinibacillus sp. OF-1]|uniref:epsilon-toxin family protein n=1 Tax=Lysinibacillus sp. OF-1 TaxID=2972483 RepID=UPI00232E1DBF|nr:epsilon-toxin family protein [Lysinibacillus sp. OF-1]WCH49920.1 epsilon-toxin family protein [Lysinibacillus sp. OF-1]